MFGMTTRTKSGMAPLYTRMKIGGKSHWINLMLRVDAKQWSAIAASPKRQQNYLIRCGHWQKLTDIELGLIKLKDEHNRTKENIDKMVVDIVYADSRERYKKQQELGKEFQLKKVTPKDYIIKFVEQMETGEMRNVSGDRYATGTIKAWKQFKRVFLDFYYIRPFHWEDIDQVLVNRFMGYMEQNEYNKKTINKYLKTFKQVLIDAERYGYNPNSFAKSGIRLPKVKESEKMKEIYLTKDEIGALYDMKLGGTREIARDLFLIGCYTAFRFSDFSAINETWIRVDKDGNKSIVREQKKTGQSVVIRLFDDKLIALLEKYNYNVPSITDQALNRTIKEIAQELSASVPSLAKKEITILKKQEKMAEKEGQCVFERDSFGNVVKPRWQLISTHTARRSCITNMYISGKYNREEMMSVSGHRDYKTFNEYIKLSLDEKAERVAKAGGSELF